ncbi:MAG: MutH/Sau3AI family endonuclease [Actinomycetota bacterium]|nr:MutH/Sau3AI family endonuclease [Actinomycetota bacterium]
MFKNGKQNKGWKGLVLERLAGLNNNCSKASNGENFELKSVAFYYVKGKLVPKETMAITMINKNELRDTSFYKSHCWQKLKTIIFCAVSWEGKNIPKSKLLKVDIIDLEKDRELIDEIESDYEYIRNKLVMDGFESLTGKDGKWIQARTKGAGHGSRSRAFYARKRFIEKILDYS